MPATAPPQPRTTSPAPDLFADRELLHALSLALQLVSRAQQRTLALALGQIGDVDLPPATPATADDQALIRAIATLYLASQLELAGLVPAVETLSGVAVGGGLPGDLGSAEGLIAAFWKARNERFHEKERRGFFARLFGAETPDDLPAGATAASMHFDDAMINLCESLYKLDEGGSDSAYGNPVSQAKMRYAAEGLAHQLLNRGTGIAAFAATEIIGTIRQCIVILQQSAVQRAFLEHSVWGVVQAIAQRYMHQERDVTNFVRRGKAGLVVLSWLADSLPSLDSPRPVVVTLDHPVIAAAEEWLESSLAVREAAATPSGGVSA